MPELHTEDRQCVMLRDGKQCENRSGGYLWGQLGPLCRECYNLLSCRQTEMNPIEPESVIGMDVVALQLMKSRDGDMAAYARHLSLPILPLPGIEVVIREHCYPEKIERVMVATTGVVVVKFTTRDHPSTSGQDVDFDVLMRQEFDGWTLLPEGGWLDEAVALVVGVDRIPEKPTEPE